MNRSGRRQLYSQLRRNQLLPTLQRRTIDEAGAQCDICQRLVDYEALVENRPGMPKSMVTILCRCHGAEERQEFDLGTEQWDEMDVARAMKRVKWFDPTTGDF